MGLQLRTFTQLAIKKRKRNEKKKHKADSCSKPFWYFLTSVIHMQNCSGNPHRVLLFGSCTMSRPKEDEHFEFHL